jgi:predicted dehydrogenase
MADSKAHRKHPIGIGIVGAGLMGSIHADCYSRRRDCRIVGYFSRTPARAQELAARYGGEVYGSLDEMLADRRVDAVNLSTPQAVHAAQVIAAARAGKHIFCEKPVGLTGGELDAMERAVRRAGVTFMAGHQLRFHPVVCVVRKNLPRLGALYHLDIEWTLRIAGHKGRCWESYRLGGFFMELGCHVADLAQYLFGPVADMSAYTLRLNPERITEDYTNCLLKFESGAVGSILVSANHRTGRQGLMRGRVIGEKGRIDFTVYPYARSFNSATLVFDHGKSVFVPDVTVRRLRVSGRPSPHRVYAGFFDVYEQEAAAFLKAVRTGTEPPCTFADGRRAVEVVLAAYHHQGMASRRCNFVKRPSRYRSDAACHPLLKRGPAER